MFDVSYALIMIPTNVAMIKRRKHVSWQWLAVSIQMVSTQVNSLRPIVTLGCPQRFPHSTLLNSLRPIVSTLGCPHWSCVPSTNHPKKVARSFFMGQPPIPGVPLRICPDEGWRNLFLEPWPDESHAGSDLPAAPPSTTSIHTSAYQISRLVNSYPSWQLHDVSPQYWWLSMINPVDSAWEAEGCCTSGDPALGRSGHRAVAMIHLHCLTFVCWQPVFLSWIQGTFQPESGAQVLHTHTHFKNFKDMYDTVSLHICRGTYVCACVSVDPTKIKSGMNIPSRKGKHTTVSDQSH